MRTTLARNGGKNAFRLVAGAGAAVMLAACAPQSARTAQDSGSFAGKTITYIVPSSAGGGFDTTARLVAPYLAKALKAHVEVVDKPGGEFAVGAQAVLNSGASCTNILIDGVPDIQFSFLTQHVAFTDSDFYAVSGMTISPAVYIVNKKSRFHTLRQLVTYAKAHPGTLKMSLNGLTSGNFLSVFDLEKATGAKFNMVPFTGGHEAREAIVAGTANVTNAGLFEAQDIATNARALAVDMPKNKWPQLTNGAPTVNQALGTHIPPEATTFGTFVTAKCHSSDPKAYQTLARGFQTALSDPAYLAKLKSLGQQDSRYVVSGSAYQQQVRQGTSDIRQLLKKNPGLFAGSS